MKIRSIEELANRLDENLSWRRLELLAYQQLLWKHRDHIGKPSLEALIRGAIVLSYANWEGFFKEACEAFLVYLNTKSYDCRKLPIAICALSFNQQVSKSSQGRLHERQIGAMEKIFSRASAPLWPKIKTNSNLNTEILEEDLAFLGIEANDLLKNRDFIDEQLLSTRNSIAHGEAQAHSYYGKVEETLQLMNKTLDLLVIVREKILDQANAILVNIRQ